MKGKKVDFGKLATKSIVATGTGGAATLAVMGMQKIPFMADKPILVTAALELVGLGLCYFGNGNANAEASGYAMQGVAGYRGGYNIAAMVTAGANDPGVVNGTLNASGQKKLAALQRMAKNAQATLPQKTAAARSQMRTAQVPGVSSVPSVTMSVMRPGKRVNDRRSRMFYCN